MWEWLISTTVSVMVIFWLHLVINKIIQYFSDLKRDIALLKFTPKQRRSIEWEKDLIETDGMMHWSLEKEGQLPSQEDKQVAEFVKKFGIL